MVYTGFRNTRLDIPDPSPAQLAPNQHDEEEMDSRPDQEEMEQAINKLEIPAAVGEAREEGLQGPGHPQATVTVAQACTRVRSLHVCG